MHHRQTAASGSSFEGIIPETGIADVCPRAASVNGTTSVIKPDFFIVGAPKCGTTALADYLALHPEIFMARKEMHFFGKDLRFADHFYRRAEREYLVEFAGWSGQRRIGEASVWYLFSETAAAEIKAFNPRARIIVLLREPAEMMYSLFHYFRYDGNEPLASFQEALNAEDARRFGRQTSPQTYLAQALVYRAVASFTAQVQRYQTVFGRAGVRVVLFEDLAADPAMVYRDTLRFLDVDSAHTLPEFPRVNEARAVKSRAMRAVFNHPVLRSTLLTLRPLLPQPVFQVFQRIESVLWRCNSSTAKPPPLDPELKSRLRREFAPEIRQLSELIGRDLSHWHAEASNEQRTAVAAQTCLAH